MALAALVGKVRTSNLGIPLRVRAFVVDHQAREGSAEEAKVVASRLRKLGELYRLHGDTQSR